MEDRIECITKFIAFCRGQGTNRLQLNAGVDGYLTSVPALWVHRFYLPRHLLREYLTESLVSELGECLQEIRRWKNRWEDHRGSYYDGELHHRVTSELGDFMFYLACLGHELGVDWGEVTALNVEKADSYNRRFWAKRFRSLARS